MHADRLLKKLMHVFSTTQIAEKLEKCFFPKRFFHLKPNIYLFDTQLFQELHY